MNKDVTNTFDAEPKAPTGGSAHLPLWLTGLLGLLFYWGCYYVDEHGSGFNQFVYAPYYDTNELARIIPSSGDESYALGRAKYQQICMPCHQESGLGVPNQFPPLAGSEWVNAPGAGRIIRIAQTGLTGPVKVKGVEYGAAAAMPAMGATLTDKELAAVLTYIRSTWGNKGSKVTEAQVKAVRGVLGGRTEPHTAEELQKTPETE
jgi:mono/diheme cytochrome c family protein